MSKRSVYEVKGIPFSEVSLRTLQPRKTKRDEINFSVRFFHWIVLNNKILRQPIRSWRRSTTQPPHDRFPWHLPCFTRTNVLTSTTYSGWPSSLRHRWCGNQETVHTEWCTDEPEGVSYRQSHISLKNKPPVERCFTFSPSKVRNSKSSCSPSYSPGGVRQPILSGTNFYIEY